MNASGLSPLFLWRLAGPFKARAAAVFALIVVDSGLASLGIGLILPVTAALLFREGEHEFAWMGMLDALSYRERIVALSILILSVFLLKAVVSFAHALLARDFAERMRCLWMERIGERYLNGRFSELATRRQGAAVNDWFNEPGAAARFLLAYMGYLSALLLTCALLAVSLVIEWRVTAAFVVGALLIGFILSRTAYGRIARMSGVKLQHSQALSAAISENVGQLREVKLLGLEGRRLAELSQVAAQLKRIFVRLAVSGEAPRIVGELAAVTVFVATLLGLVLAGMDAREMIPLLAFFFVAFYRLVTAGMQAVSGRIKALADLRSVELVHDLSTTSYESESRGAGVPVPRIATDLLLEEIEFGFGSEPVLRGISFRIPIGKLTFLVGPSGAGKSTILDLLMRLHSPDRGRIVANGEDIQVFDLAQWRRRLGYVSQDAALFNGTVRMNVQLGEPKATEDEIMEACNLAGVHEFLRDLPAGMDSVVGHRGYAISGGQGKRIAIARMLVRQPDFLILDEATSAFEQAMENTIIARVRSRFPDMGVLQITHRLDAARGADYIVMLDQGRLVAAGAWNELALADRAHLGGD